MTMIERVTLFEAEKPKIPDEITLLVSDTFVLFFAFNGGELLWSRAVVLPLREQRAVAETLKSVWGALMKGWALSPAGPSTIAIATGNWLSAPVKLRGEVDRLGMSAGSWLPPPLNWFAGHDLERMEFMTDHVYFSVPFDRRLMDVFKESVIVHLIQLLWINRKRIGEVVLAGFENLSWWVVWSQEFFNIYAGYEEAVTAISSLFPGRKISVLGEIPAGMDVGVRFVEPRRLLLHWRKSLGIGRDAYCSSAVIFFAKLLTSFTGKQLAATLPWARK